MIHLPSGVIDLAEEVGIVVLRGLPVLAEPQRKDEVMPGEEDGQQAEIVDSEPLVSSVRRHGGEGGEHGGHDARGDCGGGLDQVLVVGGGGEGGLDDDPSCFFI